MTTEPKKPRARKAPAAKAPETEAPAAKTLAATAPAAAPAAKPAAASAGPQGLLMAGVVIVLIALAGLVWLIATGRGAPAPVNNMAEATAAAPAMPNRGQLLPSGLRIETIHEGTGALVTPADTPLVRYELRVYGRGGVVESNFDAPQASPMPLQGVIPGFAEALTHMRPGSEVRFWVPPSLGYGPSTPPGAPFGPNDILEFRVKVEGLAPAGHGAAPEGGGNTLSEEDLQNIVAAMNEQQAAGGH